MENYKTIKKKSKKAFRGTSRERLFALCRLCIHGKCTFSHPSHEEFWHLCSQYCVRHQEFRNEVTEPCPKELTVEWKIGSKQANTMQKLPKRRPVWCKPRGRVGAEGAPAE